MKKLMASTIIILPLLLLAILLVSGAILSLITHIYVESVEFTKKDAIVLLWDDEDNPPTQNIMDEINIFPSNAKNRDLIFKSSNENVATVNENGVVSPVFYGQAYITVQSKENLSAVAKRKVVIKGTTVHKFDLNNVPAEPLHVGDRIQLSVNVLPIDALNKGQKWESDHPEILKVNANGFATVVGVGQAKITVTSLGNNSVSASATITCNPKEQKGFKVFCADTEIQNGKTYRTFLDSLTFEVANGQKAITYQTNNTGEWKRVENGLLTVDTTTVHDLSFKYNDSTISFTLGKAEFDNFNLDIFATLDTEDGSRTLTLEKIENANEKSEIPIMLAKNVQDCFTLQVNLDEDVLGGFGSDENFARFLAVEEKEDYEVSYDSLNNQIVISFPGMKDFQQNLTLDFGKGKSTLKLNRVAISQFEFTNETESFDCENSGDVHKGYQQVTVYAKHSYYNEKVDYFKIPFKAFTGVDETQQASPDTVNWKLSRFVGDKEESVLTYQIGNKVIVGEKTYQIVKDDKEYVLKDADNLEGEAVSGKDGKNENGIIWVDAFSETGYARIYFGNFKGLLESDVQNDYFGNFDEKQNWIRPTENIDDGSGRDYKIHEGNSFTFLRVQADDGTTAGVNRHFNFNVLDDDTLVNVFNANGYYANSKIVLQSDLYGDGELGESGENFDYATKNGLFLTKAENLDKTIIFGNGYQVNFQAKNASMTAYSESVGVSVEKAYNTLIKCANPTEEINNKNQKMVLKMNYAYYCALSYYYKFNPMNSVFYVKNTVISGVPKAAIQLYYNNLSLYAENLVMVECGAGIMVDNPNEQNVNIYFKENVDVLDYANRALLANMNELINALYDMVAVQVKDYLEWHGKTVSASVNDYTGDVERFYVNVVAYGMSDLGKKTYIWSDNEYKKVSDGAALSDGTKIVSKDLAFGFYYALTYEIMGDNGTRLDNANVTQSNKIITGEADMNSLFTAERYIRLQCEFTDVGVKNVDHILWHKQQAYRDVNLIEDREPSHVENLRKSLAGVQWQDGSGVDENGIPYATQNSTINRILSCADLPKKEEI